jgi:hypothetical protein
MIRKEPISERFAARRLAFAPPKWGFAMPPLRLDRLIALTPLVLLLLSGDVPGLAILAPTVPSQPAAVTEPSAALDRDAPITEQLRNLAKGKFDPIVGSTKERESIDAFYANRSYAPLWITEGKANARANAVIAYLGGVAADGLDPTDYPVPNFA